MLKLLVLKINLMIVMESLNKETEEWKKLIVSGSLDGYQFKSGEGYLVHEDDLIEINLKVSNKVKGYIEIKAKNILEKYKEEQDITKIITNIEDYYYVKFNPLKEDLDFMWDYGWNEEYIIGAKYYSKRDIYNLIEELNKNRARV